MEVLHPHCAGLDVHKETVVACVRHMVDGTIKREVRTFDTTTTSLLVALAGDKDRVRSGSSLTFRARAGHFRCCHERRQTFAPQYLKP